ncbi:MAG: GTP-dependent dephospho-CoA kinase family protein [Salinirussus sp.]
MGPVYTEADRLLADAGEPLITIGDVVTYHLIKGGQVPKVAVVDERTQRGSIDQEITAGITGFDRSIAVRNQAATLSAELLTALAEAISSPETVVLEVEGEEDLATLPALLAAPDGASIVYGQPDEGMVLVPVNATTRGRARDLLQRMAGDTAQALALLNVAGNPDGANT